MKEQKIECPKCGYRFPVSEALASQVEDRLRRKFEADAKDKEKVMNEAFEKRMAAETVKIRKKAEMEIMEKAAKKAEASFRKEKKQLEKKARDAEKEAKAVKKAAADLEKRERKVEDREQKFDAEIASKVKDARKKAEAKATEKLDKEYRSRELQHQRTISSLEKKLSEAKRAAEQASQQTQGEAFERELERLLLEAFPDDEIRAVSKGKRGADIVHHILTRDGHHCGTIVWESKNTKNWSKSWLAKVKGDQKREKADFSIIVSTALPKELQSKFDLISGVWVADWSVAVGLGALLRSQIIEMARMKLSEQGKTEKMEVLYQYLMSREFRQRVEEFVSAFRTMKEELDSERQTMERLWSKREKQLHLVLQNISGMVGDIQAIVPAFPKIRRLELPAPRGQQ